MTKKTIKVFFFGTPDIGVATLQSIFEDHRFEIVGVGVFPDRPVGRKKILTPCPVKVLGERLDLPLFEISKKEDVTNALQKTNPDIGLVIAFGFLFTQEHIESIPFGMVNVHFSLLPHYRGASPVQSAILEGGEISGISWQCMVKALDAGDILSSRSYPLEEKTTAEIFEWFGDESAKHTGDILVDFVSGKVIPTPQNELQASYCSKFIKQDGAVDLQKDRADDIFKKWRAFQPWPGIYLEASLIKILEVSLAPKEQYIPIKCEEDTILFIKTIQIPGKNPMLLEDALRGSPELGQIFQKA